MTVQCTPLSSVPTCNTAVDWTGAGTSRLRVSPADLSSSVSEVIRPDAVHRVRRPCLAVDACSAVQLSLRVIPGADRRQQMRVAPTNRKLDGSGTAAAGTPSIWNCAL